MIDEKIYIKLIYKVIKDMHLENDKYVDIGFTGLTKGLQKYDSKKMSTTYLYKTIKNEILMNIRKEQSIKKKGVSFISLETPIDENLILEDVLTDNSNILDTLINKEIKIKIIWYLNTLKLKECIVLSEYLGLFDENLNLHQISKKHDIPVSTVYKIVKKQKIELRRLLKNYI